MLSICVPTLETYCPQQKMQYPGNVISRLAGPGNEAKVTEEFCKSPNHSEPKSMYRKLLPFNEHKGLLNYMTTVFVVGCLK